MPPTPNRTRRKRTSLPQFEIHGHVANSDQVLCASARDRREAGRMLAELLENPSVCLVEVLRFDLMVAVRSRRARRCRKLSPKL